MRPTLSDVVKPLLARVAVVRREDGQGLVEYALITALVSIAALAILTGLGAQIVSLLANVTSQL